MKIVFAIIITVLLLAVLGFYLVLVLNAHDMTFCGDVANPTGGGHVITRVYTADLNADETLSEIVLKMNESEGTVSAEELTEILATYQNIIYAPVFTVNIEQVDSKTFVLWGSAYNGVSESGVAQETDYYYKDMNLTAAVQNGKILAAQNVYPLMESGQEEFVERKNTVDPIVTDENRGAAFSFRDCDSFRIVFSGNDAAVLPKVTLVYTYNVRAQSPLNFTGTDNSVLAYTVSVAYNDKGELTPELNFERNIIVKED